MLTIAHYILNKHAREVVSKEDHLHVPGFRRSADVVREFTLVRQTILPKVWLSQCPAPDYASHFDSPLARLPESEPVFARDWRSRGGTERGYHSWTIAIYLLATNFTLFSSMKLHWGLEIMQESGRNLVHCTRATYLRASAAFDGKVDVDGTCVVDRRVKLPRSKQTTLSGRSVVDKALVAGSKDRANRGCARTFPSGDAKALDDFVLRHASKEVTVNANKCSDHEVPVRYGKVCYKAGEHVCEQIKAQEIESVWSMSMCALKCTLHKFSLKRLNCGVTEIVGETLRYRDLTADNGLISGAQF